MTPGQAAQAALDAIDPDRLDMMADWFDADDKVKMWLYEVRPDIFPGAWKERGDAMQTDLRRWAKLVREARTEATQDRM
jgi:hypothetical protein